MTQSIFGFGIGGSGIVSVLIIAGILLIGTNASVAAGQIAIWGGIVIGITMGGLGVIGILSRFF